MSELEWVREPGKSGRYEKKQNGGSSSVLTSEPSDESISTGEAKLWWEDTVGAPTLHVKGKDSAGTVFTATIPTTEEAA